MKNTTKILLTIVLIFLSGRIVIELLDAYKLTTLWFIICILLEVILLKLLYVKQKNYEKQKQRFTKEP